ncbi:hypothetical protein Droror1_Dr00000965 [Drosera rotundifolia]
MKTLRRPATPAAAKVRTAPPHFDVDEVFRRRYTTTEQQLDAVVDRRGVSAAITSIVAANLCQISSLQFPVLPA